MSRIIEAARRILPAERVESWDEFKSLAVERGLTGIRIKESVVPPFMLDEKPYITCYRRLAGKTESGRNIKVRGNSHLPFDISKNMEGQERDAEKRLHATVGQELAELRKEGLRPVPRIVGRPGTGLTTLMDIEHCATDPKIERLALNNGDIFKAPQK